jgi:hypothetical protein
MELFTALSINGHTVACSVMEAIKLYPRHGTVFTNSATAAGAMTMQGLQKTYFVVSVQSSSLLSKNTRIKIYRTIILPVVLYGCETWSLTLREEHRLRVFENRVLRMIFGPKRDEVTGVENTT